MGIVSLVAIYFILWWLIFFLALTAGNRDPDPEAVRVRGAEQGAPARPALLRKVVYTTIGAAIALAALVAVLESGLTLDDIPMPGPPGL